MNILEVPERFRPPGIRSVAEAFYDTELSPNTDRIYIPIFWSNCYHEYCTKRNDPVFRAVPDIQKFLDDNLDPAKEYFTVTRCDEGIYEDLPDNVLVFGSGDNAGILIPLAVDLSHTPPGEPKYLASFVGCKRSGGPRPSTSKPAFSNYDPEGIGTQIRTKMFAAFKEHDDCLLIDQAGGNDEARQTFRSTMRQTKYALCPRGYAPTSFRLYEAMALGTVPIYISDKFLLPYSSHVFWSKFCVLCRENEINDLPAQLRSISKDWQRMAVNYLTRLYPEYFNLAGTCRQIARRLEDGI